MIVKFAKVRLQKGPVVGAHPVRIEPQEEGRLCMFIYTDRNGKHVVSGENCPPSLLLKIWARCKQRFPGGQMEYLRGQDDPDRMPHTDPGPLEAA